MAGTAELRETSREWLLELELAELGCEAASRRFAEVEYRFDNEQETLSLAVAAYEARRLRDRIAGRHLGRLLAYIREGAR